jgi:hypothetical protein
MQIYRTKTKKFFGTKFREVHRPAFGLYTKIKKKTKRRTYVRSAYFNKGKFEEKTEIFDFGIPGRRSCLLLKTKKDLPLSVVWKPRPKAFFLIILYHSYTIVSIGGCE